MIDMSIFEAKALAAALTKAGHSVSERTVQRWKKGDTQPKPQDEAAIRRLLGVEKDPDQSLDWPGLMKKLDAVVVAVDARVGETPEQRVARLAVEGTGEPPPQSGGDESTGRGRRAPVRPRPGVRPGQ